MSTILHTLARALRAFSQACGEYPFMGLLGPIWWPAEIYRDAPMREPR